MTRFRPARPEEAPAIAALWHAGWRDAHLEIVPQSLAAFRSAERFLARTEAALDRMILAEEAGALQGMALLSGDELEQFYLAGAARGTGLAPRLMAEAEALLAAAGHRRAWLACTAGNLRARRFYERQRWRHVRDAPMRIETPEGDIVITIWRMEKDLAISAPPKPCLEAGRP
jgi:GNAT superfamily N-acetyltransferase